MIRKLMELGVMVAPEAAKLLENADADKVAEKLLKMKPMPFSVDAALAKKLLADEAEPRLLRKITEMKGMSIPDFTAAYNERYSALQRALLKNAALSNVASVASAAGECCIIGMVKNGGKLIEDPSGEGALVADIKLLDGDVVGAIGAAENGAFKAREIIFPGLQLKEKKEAFGIVTAGRTAGAIRTDATAFYDANGTLIAVSHATLGKDEAVELLKRRHLTVPPKDFLEPQPDFLICNSKENFTENHKNVAIIGIAEGAAAEIDLNTRETVFK